MSLGVAILNPCYWPEVTRGSERIIHDLAAGLVDQGHGARIITSHPHRPTRSVEDGVEVVRNWRPPDRPLRNRQIQPYLTHLPFSYLSLRRGDDDIAHSFYPTDTLAALRWKRDTGRPVVFTWAGLANRQALASRWHGPQVIARATSGADKVLSFSHAARDALWRWLRVESHVIYPGVDLNAFTPAGDRAAHPTVICPADLTDARKRGDVLLAAFRLLRRSRPQARLLVAKPATAQLERELIAEPGVTVMTFDDESLARAYGTSHVMALPSRAEAFGLVVVEALACGTPAIVSDDGGSAEIVDAPEIGARIAGDDPWELARALDEAIAMADAPGTARACRARAEQFGTGIVTAAHVELYRELLQDSAQAGARA